MNLNSKLNYTGWYNTRYAYDGMDRIKTVTYSDGTASGSFSYSNLGKLMQSANTNVTNNYTAFDGNGRVTASSVQAGSSTYTFGYQYDLAGDLIQETYPSGRQVNTSYDIAMRPLTVNGASAGTTTPYVQQVSYFPHGVPQYWWYGSNLWNWQSVNQVLQPTESWAMANGSGNQYMFFADNGFNPNGTTIAQIQGYGPAVPWNSMTFNNDQFAYDSVNRLFSVTDTVYGGGPTNYTRTYSYDEYGNRSISGYTNLAPSGFTPINSGTNPYNTANNHLNGASYGYEQRGNIASVGSGSVTMGYDGESNLTKTVDSGTGQTISWIYDAEGQRAEKVIAGGATTVFVHDAFGQLSAEYNSVGVTPACVTCYLTYDMLGTPRMITDQNQLVVARHDYVAFGEEIPDGSVNRNGNFKFTSNVTQGFTGQESDGGTAALDYYNARTYGVNVAGFLQPDPGNAGADLGNPQSWNGYGYVLGNPLGLVDPSGMFAEANPPPPQQIQIGIPCSQLTSYLNANGSGGGPIGVCGSVFTTSFTFPSQSGGGSGAPVQSPPAKTGTPPTWRQRANCASDFGNKYSLAAGFSALTGGRVSADNPVVSTLLGNDASALSNIATGRDPLGSTISEVFSNPTSANLATHAVVWAGAIPTGGAATAELGVNGAGTYFVKTFSTPTVAGTVVGRVAGAVLSKAVAAKAIYDFTTYGIGLATCW